MPIYEYRCGSCGHELEAMQKLADAPLTDCPECGDPALKKLISAVGFRLKGGGWYETDFKTANKRNLAEGGDKKAEAGKSDSKADSGKPAGKTDPSKSESKSKDAAPKSAGKAAAA